MKPLVKRTSAKRILLTGFVFLGACFGLCTNCLAAAECVLLPSNAATDIRSTVGTRKPGAREGSLPSGWRVSYPLFEGDYFSVMLPAALPDSSERGTARVDSSRLSHDAGRRRVRRAVETIVSHMGSAEPASGPDLTDEFFTVEPYEMRIGGGDILKVAQINCESGQHAGPDKRTGFCSLDEGQRRRLIERATGMTADAYLDRKLTRYYYFQRPQYREWPWPGETSDTLCARYPGSHGECLNVFIEHVAIAATLRSDDTVASINGRVFSKYRITNEPELPAEKAVAAAYEQLWNVPGISPYEDQPDSRQTLPLVLLPDGHANRSDLSRLGSFRWPRYRTPQLRYAYRTTLWGNFVDEFGQSVEAASWRAWVDAETGDILQLIPQFEFAGVEASGKGWRLHPSHPVGADDLPIETTFEVDEMGSGTEVCQCPDGVVPSGRYCLKLDKVFGQVKYVDGKEDEQGLKKFCSTTSNFSEGVNCAAPWDCLCLENDDLTAVRYLLMNAYAHIYAYKRKLDTAICSSANGAPPTIQPVCDAGIFQAAKNKGSPEFVPLRVQVGGESRGFYEAEAGSPHLTFGEVDEIFAVGNCTSLLGLSAGKRPGAQDATLMTHEFAHVVMDGLLTSRPDNWCGAANCSVPLSSDVVHDMADGLSAVSNLTNWFGKWRGNDANPELNHNEQGGTIRKFDYDIDHFPEHRVRTPITFHSKGYADGQIAAAALWVVTDKMNSWGGEVGQAAFETAVLNALPDHFFPNACQAAKKGNECDYPDDCDIDVYRYLHFLLDRLIANDSATGVTVTSNKVTAGFARAGIFLVPPRCIGASTGANLADEGNAYCPQAHPTYGGDAVIDITDDWLKKGTEEASPQAPEFDVWTGPQFRFQGTRAELSAQPPCNPYFKISIANNPDFVNAGANLSRDTGWLGANEKCQGHWELGADADWISFWESISDTSERAYYRVVTGNKNAQGEVVPLSSSEYPGKPFYTTLDVAIDPPFAVLNETGWPE